MKFTNRTSRIAKIPKENLNKLNIRAKDMTLPDLPTPRKKRELQWRKHKHTNISWLKNKRIKIVEDTKKGKFTISGLNKSELEKVRTVL